MGDLYRRIHYLLNRRKLERELTHDMAVHREMLSAESRRDFGNPTLLREQSHEAWGWSWLDHLFQDLRFGTRLLKKSPALALTAIAVLSLGIGVNLAVFNIIDVFLFKPLPVRDARSLVRFMSQSPHGRSADVPYPSAMFYAENNQVLSSVLLQRWSIVTLSEQTSQPVFAALVSPNYFSDLGTRAAYGRLFLPASDGTRDAQPVVVLSYRFWQGHFGGDASVIGRTIRVNQRPVTVIGVTPYNFFGLELETGVRFNLWLLLPQEPYFVTGSTLLTSFDTKDSRVRMWGRLKPGVSMKTAEQALLPLTQELAGEHPDVLQKDEHLAALPGGAALRLEASDLPLFALLCTLFLLILATACGNLGSLLMGRAVTRQHEVSIRMSLGATRRRILRQLMTENVLLAGAGAVAGLFLSWILSRSLVIWLGGPGAFDFTPDWRTLLCAVGMGVVSCVLFGLAPSKQLIRQPHKASHARTLFMSTQIAASCVLLVVSALLVRALNRALTLNPGFDYQQMLTVDPELYAHAYQPAAASAYLQELQTRLRQAPGVDATALATCPPMGNRTWLHTQNNIDVYINQVSPQFFETMAIPILQGRTFAKSDHDVVIVSQSYARQVWPGKDPLQQKYDLGNQKLQVIGIVGNARAVGMSNGDAKEMYQPIENRSITQAVVLVRTRHRPEDVAGPIADFARSVNPVISPQVVPVKDAFAERIGLSGKIAGIITGMGLLALLLAVIGLYGVVAYTVSQSIREIGIRIALGATTSRLVRNVLGRFVAPLGIALAAGVGLAAAASLVIRKELYGVSNMDPLSYLAAVLLLTAAAILAALIPARRALRVDPVVALRCE
jgi:predicted permease